MSDPLECSLQWNQQMNFSLKARDLTVMTDASSEHGGLGLGPTPKEYLLHAMMGCTAMDVVAIITKMRLTMGSFTMTSKAWMTDTHPIHFKRAALTFIFKDVSPDRHQDDVREKVAKAVNSSMTKYCGVNFMISKACPIDVHVVLEGTEISQFVLDHSTQG